MNRREREIGERLKEFRQAIKWSQSKFADQIGVSRDQLASIEYSRTPLRYELAWRIRDSFGLSIDWLWGGDMPPDHLDEDQGLPHPSQTGLPQNARLTEVFNKVYQLPTASHAELESAGKQKGVSLKSTDIKRRALMRLFAVGALDEALPQVPEDYVVDFGDKLASLMRKYVDALPKEPRELIDARHEALLWEKMRAEITSKVIHSLKRVESNLTYVYASVNTSNVKAQWPLLKQRLQQATAHTGGKSRLAKFLGVQLASVSQWLTDSDNAREPGAETALRMLTWVEQQERK